MARIVQQARVAVPHLVGPDLARGVHFRIGGAGATVGRRFTVGNVLQREAVELEVGGVGRAADAAEEVVGDVARQAVGAAPLLVAGDAGVVRTRRDHEGIDVAPALAHAVRLVVAAVGQAVVHVVEVLVGNDLVVERAVGVHRGRPQQGHGDGARGECVLDPLAVVLADEHRRDGVGRCGRLHRAHRHVDVAHARRRIAVGVVDDHHRDGAGGLRELLLGGEVAVAAVDQRDLAGQRRLRRRSRGGRRHRQARVRCGRPAAVAGRGADAVVGQRHHLAGDGVAGRADVVERGPGQRAAVGRRGHPHFADRRAIEQVLLHGRRGPVGRRAHVGVVAAGGVLRLRLHRVAVFATAPVVVGLGVAGFLVEAVVVPPVVQPVVDVEQVDHRGLRGVVGARVGVGDDGVVEAVRPIGMAARIAQLRVAGVGGRREHVVGGVVDVVEAGIDVVAAGLGRALR